MDQNTTLGDVLGQSAQPAVYQPGITQLPNMNQPQNITPIAQSVQPIPSQQIPSQGNFDSGLLGLGTSQRGLEMQKESVAAGGELAIQKGEQAGKILEGLMKQIQITDHENKIKTEEVRKQAENEFNKYTQLRDEFNTMKVDPNRFWNNKGTGEKIIAAIAIGLGALGQGLSKGAVPNAALQIINSAIDNDINAQKSNILATQGKLDAQKGIYGQMLQKLGDEKSAAIATKAAYLQNAQLKLQTINEKFAGSEQANKALGIIGQIQQQQDQLNQEMIKNLAYKALMTNKNLDPNMLPEKERERYVPGYGLALSSTDAKGAKEVITTNKTTQDAINELKDIADKGYWAQFSPEQRGQAQLIQNKLIGALRTAIVGPGAMQENERLMIRDMIADPTKIWSLGYVNKAKLEKLSELMDNYTNRSLQSFGIPVYESKTFKVNQ